MLFEGHAWVLVPIIVVTVAAWNAASTVVAAWLKRRPASRA